MSNLPDAEFELYTYFEKTPDLVCIAGKDGYFRNINQAVIDKLGYTKEELFASPISTFIHPEDKEYTQLRRNELLNGKPLINFDNRYLTKSGNTVWLHWTSIYFPEKEVVLAIAKDVTHRKGIEKELEEKYTEFKNLASYFKTSMERDKKFLASELHEGMAQLATVAKIDMEWLRQNPDLDNISKNRVEHAAAALDLLIDSIRRMSYSISPAMLEDVGLNETLRWLSEEFTILTGIPCFFESTFDDSQLTNEIELDLFRICEELLTNILDHGQANSVNISIELDGDKLGMTIKGDGRCFDIEDQKVNSALTNMHKRAASINGKLTINRDLLKGTTICVTVPYLSPVAGYYQI